MKTTTLKIDPIIFKLSDDNNTNLGYSSVKVIAIIMDECGTVNGVVYVCKHGIDSAVESDYHDDFAMYYNPA